MLKITEANFVSYYFPTNFPILPCFILFFHQFSDRLLYDIVFRF